MLELTVQERCSGFPGFGADRKKGMSEEGQELVESISGDLGHHVVVVSAVQRDCRHLGGNGSGAVLRQPVSAVEHNQETPVELR